jgi:hypothetical protein
MNDFEYLLTLFGLVLGLAIAEVMGGLARTFEAGPFRRLVDAGAGKPVRVGWLTPLLGIYVLLNLIANWTATWRFRELIPIRYDALFVGLVVTSVYYLGSRMVFPKEPEQWPDLDEHFLRIRRLVAGCILLGTGGANIAAAALEGAPPGFFLLNRAEHAALLIALCLLRDRKDLALVLACLVLLYLVPVGVAWTHGAVSTGADPVMVTQLCATGLTFLVIAIRLLMRRFRSQA